LFHAALRFFELARVLVRFDHVAVYEAVNAMLLNEFLKEHRKSSS
jgi:hypothetical protein